METQLPPRKKGNSPQFSAHVCCGQNAGWIKMPLGMELGLGPGDFLIDGDIAPSQKRAQSLHQFSAHVYCGQTAGWIQMPLGTEVGLDPGHIVLDWDPGPPKKRAHPPIFGPCLLWPNGWMHQDTTWYEGRPSAQATPVATISRYRRGLSQYRDTKNFPDLGPICNSVWHRPL